MRLVPLGGSCEIGKVPSPGGAPSLVGRSAETKRELQRFRGMQQLACDRQNSERPAQTVLATSLHSTA